MERRGFIQAVLSFLGCGSALTECDKPLSWDEYVTAAYNERYHEVGYHPEIGDIVYVSNVPSPVGSWATRMQVNSRSECGRVFVAYPMSWSFSKDFRVYSLQAKKDTGEVWRERGGMEVAIRLVSCCGESLQETGR